MKEEDFEVFIKSDLDSNTEIITSYDDLKGEEFDFSNRIYSAYLKDGFPVFERITPEYLDKLAENAQNSLSKILTINDIIRCEINKNDIIGKTVECIDTNINTKVKLSYNDEGATGRNNAIKLNKAKNMIDLFNSQINIKDIIRKAVITAYAEGNYIMYLRKKGDVFKVDYYPLGVCEISDYDINGEPIVLFNINELRNRLIKFTRCFTSDKSLFFENLEKEIEANYPPEVFMAYKNKEKYAVLNPKYTGVIRIGDLNRKYGLSPIFKVLKLVFMLNTFDNSDRINSKAKAKKIIHQKMRKEVMGPNYDKRGFEEMKFAHENFMEAWKYPTVVVTTPPTVESIAYVEPKIELTNTDTVNSYRSRALAALGVGFLMDSSSQSVSTASISVTQLMRTINKISEQLEVIFHKWYVQIFKDKGMNTSFCPDIKIIDSEELDFELRKDFATALYTIFNGSLETSLDILGININDETAKRRRENSKNLDSEVFYPRLTSYTSSGNNINTNETGRPSSDEKTNKTEYDKEYNKTERK